MSNVGNCFNKILNLFFYFRHDADVMEESLNDEELAADAAITETFQKLVARVSMKSFNAVLEKLKRYAQNHILEPAVAGNTFSGSFCNATFVSGKKLYYPNSC